MTTDTVRPLPARRRCAVSYEGLPAQGALLWEIGLSLAALLALALAAGLAAPS